ncbi:DUF3048 domain-containing protein [Chloroflexota bacterium]
MTKRFIMIVLMLTITNACVATPTIPAPEPTATLAGPIEPDATDTPIPSPLPATETPIPTDTAAPEPTSTDTPVAYGPANFPENVSPLTGQEVADPAILNRRPLSVKVQIFPRGQRPPMGISQADIVYDYYQNTGMTRFHAIFYAKDSEQVGPIRSGRLLDTQLVSMYQSIIAFGSADRRILQRFYSSDFASRMLLEGYGKCPPMCRTDPNGYNYLVTNTQEMSVFANANNIDNNRQDLSGMYYTALTPAGGQPGAQAFIRYSISAYNRWDYDSSSGRYLRFQDTTEAQNQEGETLAVMTDRNTGEQIATDNVVIIFVSHRYAFQTRPGLNEIIDILLDTGGSGEALALRDGMLYELQWHRPAKNSVLLLTYPDGTSYPLKPGNTWFQVVGKSSTREQGVDGGSIRIIFSIP